jgi:hypothetical protein
MEVVLEMVRDTTLRGGGGTESVVTFLLLDGVSASYMRIMLKERTRNRRLLPLGDKVFTHIFFITP